jgi:hypothetical protein
MKMGEDARDLLLTRMPILLRIGITFVYINTGLLARVSKSFR